MEKDELQAPPVYVEPTVTAHDKWQDGRSTTQDTIQEGSWEPKSQNLGIQPETRCLFTVVLNKSASVQ